MKEKAVELRKPQTFEDVMVRAVIDGWLYHKHKGVEEGEKRT